MASDSEPRKFFFEGPLEAPSEVTFREARLLMSNDSTVVEVGQ